MQSPQSDNTLIIIAAIGAVPSTIAAIFAALAMRRAKEGKQIANEGKQISAENSKSLTIVEKKVDGMTSELVAATAGQNLAEGQLMERDAERLHLSETPSPIPIVNGAEDDPIKVKLVKDKTKS